MNAESILHGTKIQKTKKLLHFRDKSVRNNLYYKICELQLNKLNLVLLHRLNRAAFIIMLIES